MEETHQNCQEMHMVILRRTTRAEGTALVRPDGQSLLQFGLLTRCLAWKDSRKVWDLQEPKEAQMNVTLFLRHHFRLIHCRVTPCRCGLLVHCGWNHLQRKMKMMMKAMEDSKRNMASAEVRADMRHGVTPGCQASELDCGLVQQQIAGGHG